MYCYFDIYCYHHFSCFLPLLLVARVGSDMTVISIIVFIFADTSRNVPILNIIIRIFIVIILDDMMIALTTVITGTLEIIYIYIYLPVLSFRKDYFVRP